MHNSTRVIHTWGQIPKREPAGVRNDPKKCLPDFNTCVIGFFEDGSWDKVRFTSGFEWKRGNVTVRPVGWMEIPK